MYGGEISGGKCTNACPKCGAPSETQRFRHCPGGFACDTTPRHETQAFHVACGICTYLYLAPVESAVAEVRQIDSKRPARKRVLK